MANQNTVWVVISAREALDKIREYIDGGYLGEAQRLHFQLKSLDEKVNSLLSEKGGRVHLSTYDKIIMEMPASVAEEIPAITLGYRQFFGTKMAIGIGMDLAEASAAANKSEFSNEIELYDPADDTFKAEFYKNGEDPFELPPNLFDPLSPPAPEAREQRKRAPKEKPVLSDPQTAMQAESAMMQAIMQQISPPPPQMPQQQEQQQQEQQPEEQQPRDLLEQLHGEQIDGHSPDSDSSASGPKEEVKEEAKPESKKDSAEDDDGGNEKIAGLLATVQDKMPKLMQLADSNPDAFKKVVNLVHKLVDMAKQKKTQKSEMETLTDQLNKALKLRLPVGTTKGRKKKVLIDGKEVWRSMAAGQVKDPRGQAVSVKSSNAKADDGQESARKR